MASVSAAMVTTAFELPGYTVTRNLGVVRGIVVRSRSIVGNIGAALQSLVGGNITLFTELCEKARDDAFRLMLQHASEQGANAVIGMRYDARSASGIGVVPRATSRAERGAGAKRVPVRHASVSRPRSSAHPNRRGDRIGAIAARSLEPIAH